MKSSEAIFLHNIIGSFISWSLQGVPVSIR
jgi:hypothetical protein